MRDETFDLSLDHLRFTSFRKNEYCAQAGNVCNSIAYINSGIFRVFYLKDDIEITTCFCKEDSITSSFDSFINRRPSQEYIQALENAELITLSFESLQKLYELSVDWQKVSRLITEKKFCVMKFKN